MYILILFCRSHIFYEYKFSTLNIIICSLQIRSPSSKFPLAHIHEAKHPITHIDLDVASKLLLTVGTDRNIKVRPANEYLVILLIGNQIFLFLLLSLLFWMERVYWKRAIEHLMNNYQKHFLLVLITLSSMCHSMQYMLS